MMMTIFEVLWCPHAPKNGPKEFPSLLLYKSNVDSQISQMKRSLETTEMRLYRRMLRTRLKKMGKKGHLHL